MKRRQQGFTLIELAVVLALIAVLVSFGVNLGDNVLQSTNRLAMLEKMAVIKQALDDYANRNGYLPCPADPALLPSNAAYGLENRGAVAGSGCVSTGAVVNVAAVWFGMVPVQNLGLDDSFSVDAWGNKLSYAVSQNHMGTNAADHGWGSYATQNASITVNSGATAAPVTLTHVNGTTGAGATYIVISHGKNGRGSYPQNGTTATTCTAGFIDSNNCDRADAIFYDSDYNEGTQATTQFDDYVVWGTNAITRNPGNLLPAACPSGCESWCAPCEATLPSTAPGTPTRVCAKFITRYSPCEAWCIWPTSTQPCP